MSASELGKQYRPDQAAASPAIRLRNVVKRYGAITAVAGVDLEVPGGTCFGLLGPNGAGKSTTMRILTARTRADEGEIEILGYPVPRESKQARALAGFVPQRDDLDEDLTVVQNLEVFARLCRVPAHARRAAIARAMRTARVSDRADIPVRALSGGLRRRLLIARGLVHEPRLVLLDEPTVGLDPQVRQDLWSLIDRLRSDGITVLMSTHYIEEAERLADEAALMSQGAVVARGAPADLIAEYAGKEVLEISRPPGELAEAEQTARAEGFPTRRTGPTVSVVRAEELPPWLADRLGAGLRRPATLEDVFVLLTGEVGETVS